MHHCFIIDVKNYFKILEEASKVPATATDAVFGPPTTYSSSNRTVHRARATVVSHWNSPHSVSRSKPSRLQSLALSSSPRLSEARVWCRWVETSYR